MRGDEWSLREFASMPSTAIFLRTRAEIKNLLCELASNAKIWGARASEHSFRFCEQLKIEWTIHHPSNALMYCCPLSTELRDATPRVMELSGCPSIYTKPDFGITAIAAALVVPTPPPFAYPSPMSWAPIKVLPFSSPIPILPHKKRNLIFVQV